jgi:hypothetical protein
MTNNQKTLEAKLNEVGLTVDEVKEWLASASADVDEIPSTNEYRESNVVFVPGNKTDDTKVYVDDVQIEGLVRANLEYDSELNFPILRLEIINPHIGMPNNCRK